MPIRRFASRILLINPARRLLLFKIQYNYGALAGLTYWATPGGKLKPAESFEQAAVRELEEETGIVVQSVGPCIARREFEWKMSSGETVFAVENFYVVRALAQPISAAKWSDAEREAICEVRWWSAMDLKQCREEIFPPDLSNLFTEALTAVPDSFGNL